MEEIPLNEGEDRKYTRRRWLALVKFLAASGVGYAGWKWLDNQPLDGGIRGGIPVPLREGLKANEKVFSGILGPVRLEKEYPRSEAAKKVRVNGDVGLDDPFFEPDAWKLKILTAKGKELSVSMEELRKLPKTEIVFNFKCIEGWSQVSWWGGVRMIDLMKHYGLEQEARLPYVGMRTPDEAYYVGIDMESALHPQTILCYEMNGKELPENHGYPLRLIIPVKYGVKHLKRIGTIFFDSTPPPDYWAERGYDYYIGL